MLSLILKHCKSLFNILLNKIFILITRSIYLEINLQNRPNIPRKFLQTGAN